MKTLSTYQNSLIDCFFLCNPPFLFFSCLFIHCFFLIRFFLCIFDLLFAGETKCGRVPSILIGWPTLLRCIINRHGGGGGVRNFMLFLGTITASGGSGGGVVAGRFCSGLPPNWTITGRAGGCGGGVCRLFVCCIGTSFFRPTRRVIV